MVKVKICGITNLDDALDSMDAGCDALGFVFYKKSPRYIIPEKASRITAQLPSSVLKVGVFVNTREDSVRRIAKMCNLDMLQFHGDESPEFCVKFHDYKVIKAFRVRDKINLKDTLDYETFAYLFDTFSKSRIGGTGKKFNWTLVRQLDAFNKPIFLSGGLNAENVAEAIKQVRPDWIDVSSAVEIKPGKKDRKKVKKFIEIVKKNA
ncbi:MAG: phosphoribosylanthranilate isomerase [Candidatus Omnitrophota bacterium]